MPERRRSPRNHLRIQPTPLSPTTTDYGPSPATPSPQPTHFYTLTTPNIPIRNVPNRLLKTKTPTIPTSTTTNLFSPSPWTLARKPKNITSKRWPPKTPSILLRTIPQPTPRLKSPRPPNLETLPCLGKYLWQSLSYPPPSKSSYLKIYCPRTHLSPNAPCGHNLRTWLRGASGWKSRVQLVRTPPIGVGVMSKYAWERGDVLGVYFGVLLPREPVVTDYCITVDIGVEYEGLECGAAYLDAREVGGWTRFVNHSCGYNCVFLEARVGVERVMVLVAVRRIRVGEMVTVDYGKGYFRTRVCACGVKKCRYGGKKGEGGLVRGRGRKRAR